MVEKKQVEALTVLALIWVGFLGVCNEVGEGGGITAAAPSLKPVRVTLEPSHLVPTYAPICSF